MRHFAQFTCIALLASVPPIGAQIIFQSDLSSDEGFVIVADADTDFFFGYEYASFDDIPEAPHSEVLGGEPFKGLRLEANLETGVASELATVTDGLDLSGRYDVQVDVWLNYNFPAGTAGTTEFGGLSVGHSGTETGREGASFYYDTDGDSSSDYRLYKNESLLGLDSGSYAVASRNNTSEPFVSAFPSVDIAEAVPDQLVNGSTPAGTGGFRWMTIFAEVDTDKIGAGVTANPGVSTFTLQEAVTGNSVLIGSVDNSNGGEVVTMSGDVGLLFADFFTSISDDPDLSFGLFDNLIISRSMTIPGDFNGDDVVNVDDIDLLCETVADGSHTSTFDLSGDGQVTDADVGQFLELASSLVGDTDLNRRVEFADFLALSANFGQDATWSGGDFNCNGTVEFADFLRLSANFGTVATAVANVPEPRAQALVLYILVFCVSGSRWFPRGFFLNTEKER